MVGLTGQLLGRHNINIASMSLGRNIQGGQAMMYYQLINLLLRILSMNYMMWVVSINIWNYTLSQITNLFEESLLYLLEIIMPL